MRGWSRFQSQFRETDKERRERLRESYRRQLESQARPRRDECATCPPADAGGQVALPAVSLEGCTMTEAAELLRQMPTDMLLATARNALSPALVDKTPRTIAETMDALAKQARISIDMLAALAGRT